MSNTKIISKSPGTMDVEYYEYDSPLDRLLEYHLNSDDYDSKVVGRRRGRVYRRSNEV